MWWSVLLRVILRLCESMFPPDFTNEVCLNTRSFLCYKYLHNQDAKRHYDLQTCFLYLFSFFKFIYCYSVTVVPPFSPWLSPTPTPHSHNNPPVFGSSVPTSRPPSHLRELWEFCFINKWSQNLMDLYPISNFTSTGHTKWKILQIHMKFYFLDHV